jgi:hypothetical protein
LFWTVGSPSPGVEDNGISLSGNNIINKITMMNIIVTQVQANTSFQSTVFILWCKLWRQVGFSSSKSPIAPEDTRKRGDEATEEVGEWQEENTRVL